MKIIQKTKEKLVFLTETNEELLNALRRYANQIPILAIEDVEIYMNDSPLYDETLAHRLGLIPLKSKGVINEKTNAVLKLSSKKKGYVYSGEIKGNVEVVYKDMPITILKEGQEIKINAIAKSGKGEEHAKFSPGIIFYRNTFNVKIDKDCPLEIIEVCPQKIMKVKDNKIVIEDELKCDGCELCLETCQKKGKNSIKITPNEEVLVNIESFGQLDSFEIFKKAIDLLKKDLKNVSKEIK
jgi:DNA-directed RNA polymerase subunit D